MIQDYELSEIVEEAEQRGYNKALDDFVIELKAYLHRYTVKSISDKDFDYVAEQLKRGGEE